MKVVPRGRRMPKKRSLPGYARLHKNVTKVGSRLGMVTEVGYATQFPVTYGYVNLQKRP